MSEHELPKIGAPATRALKTHGVHSLEQAAVLGEQALQGLHGVGPKAILILREAAEELGIELAE